MVAPYYLIALFFGITPALGASVLGMPLTGIPPVDALIPAQQVVVAWLVHGSPDTEKTATATAVAPPAPAPAHP